MNKLLLTLFLGINYKNKLVFAYKKLKKDKKTEKIAEIKSLIEKKKINIDKFNKFNEIYSDYKIDINLSFTQYVYQKLINLYFNCCLIDSLSNNKYFHYPLPYEWRKILVENNIKVSLLSSLFYNLLSILKFLVSIFNLIKHLFLPKHNNSINKKIYLDSVGTNILQFKNNDFLNWLKQTLNENDFQLYHSVKFKRHLSNNRNTVYCYNYFFNLISLKLKIKYFFSFLYEFIFFLIKKNSNEIFFFIDIFSFKFLLENKIELPNFAMFNNSSFVYRPLWTYIMEKRKKRSVFFYFYSVNCFARKKYMCGYSLMNWPNYLVWIDEQKVWIKNLLDYNYNLIENSYPPFEGEDKNIVIKKKKTITIFDVIPSSEMFYPVIGNPYNHYTYEFCSKFLNDVLDILSQFEVDIILKTKRLDVNNTFVFSKEYMELIMKNRTKYKFQLCEQNFSAVNLIKLSDATISIPHTTPAYLASKLNIPSVFYSNLEIIDSELLKNRSISIIKTKDNLKSWVAKSVEQN